MATGVCNGGEEGSPLNKPIATAICKHCGTPFKPLAERPDFCCTGCQFVHELIAAQGLDKFYDLTGTQGATLPPVKSFVFQKRDYAWLADLASIAERNATGAEAVLTLDLQGISCLGCVWLIERLFQRRSGAISISIQTTAGRLELRWVPGQCDIAGFAQELQRFGYLLGPLDVQPPGASRQTLTPLVRRLGLCGAFALNAMLFSVPFYFGMTAESVSFPLFTRLTFLFATLSFIVGGTYFFKRAWHGLRQGVLHIDLPIALGLIAAYSGSIYAWTAGVMNFVYFDFVSTFTFLMLVGRWVQQRAIEDNRNRLLRSRADPGEVALSGSEAKIPAPELTAGVGYRVAPGGVIPVRSKLVSTAAALGLEWINGESETTSARLGQLVPSGAVNCSQAAIELESVEPWSDSILCSLMQVTPREHRQSGVERFLRVYLAIVLVIAAAGFGGWLYASRDLLKSLQVLISILVVSCPCAAGVAIPLVDELAAAKLRTAGVFIREQSLWARLLKVRRIVFDKTGTLTLETMAIKNADSLAALTHHERSVLLSMVRDNFHPVSCCLRETLLASGTHAQEPAFAPDKLVEAVGLGLELTTGEGIWRLGRPGWLTNAETPHDCEFSKNGVVLARFVFCEQVRPDAQEEVAALQRSGFGIHILSGDRPEKVTAMATQIGLDPGDCHGGMTPQAKADWIRAAQCEGNGPTLMIGDGANDSLAFNESFCTGTPAIDRGLLEHKADFYFLGRGLSGLRHLLDAAKQRHCSVRRIIGFSIAYNAFGITLCLCGIMSPLLASVLMPASSLVSLAIVFAG